MQGAGQQCCVTGGVWAKQGSSGVCVCTRIHTHARALSPTQCHHLQEGTKWGVILSLLRRRFQACVSNASALPHTSNRLPYSTQAQAHESCLCAVLQFAEILGLLAQAGLRGEMSRFLGVLLLLLSTGLYYNCVNPATTAPTTPAHPCGWVPCGCLCCAGEVALTRAADEESLQILHVWRGA